MNTPTRKSILVVEDDVVIASTICELLDDSGYKALCAANGAVAIKILAESEMPSLILLDLMMPQMDGFEFRAKQLANSSWRDIPTIIMSADAASFSVNSKSLSPNKFFKKPLDIFSLLKEIDELVTAQA